MDAGKRELVWIGLLTLASISLVSTGIWENGDIQSKWWAVKSWADFDFAAFPPDQHLLRWGVNLPAVLWVRLFGGGPLSYLLFSHFVFVFTTVGFYALIRTLTTPLVAAGALFVWLLNPLTYNVASNFMPELFALTYVTAALLLLHKAYTQNSRWWYFGAMLVLFAAYGGKETNLFFMPGLGLYELYKRRWDNVAIMVGVFGLGFVLETLVVDWLIGEPYLLGRVQAILQGEHVQEMSEVDTFQSTDLFGRWFFRAPTNLDRLEYYSKALYWAFFAVCGWLGWRLLRNRNGAAPTQNMLCETSTAAIVMGLSFAFCTTFFILSLNPLRLGQPPLDRYLWPLVVPAMVVLSCVLHRGLKALAASKNPQILPKLDALFTGRNALVALAAIAAFCTLARWPIEIGTIHIRRHGYDQAYTVFTAEHYYARLRERLGQGCTFVFSRIRPVEAFLVHAYPHRSLQPAEQVLARQDLDGLLVDGQRLRVWPLPQSDWEAIRGKLYADIGEPWFQPYAIRLENAQEQCQTAYYLGQADIAEPDQPIAGTISPPPVAE